MVLSHLVSHEAYVRDMQQGPSKASEVFCRCFFFPLCTIYFSSMAAGKGEDLHWGFWLCLVLKHTLSISVGSLQIQEYKSELGMHIRQMLTSVEYLFNSFILNSFSHFPPALKYCGDNESPFCGTQGAKGP